MQPDHQAARPLRWRGVRPRYAHYRVGSAEWRDLGKSDDWLLANYPTLTASDLTAAWDYAAAHPDDGAIQRNAHA